MACYRMLVTWCTMSRDKAHAAVCEKLYMEQTCFATESRLSGGAYGARRTLMVPPLAIFMLVPISIFLVLSMTRIGKFYVHV